MHGGPYFRHAFPCLIIHSQRYDAAQLVIARFLFWVLHSLYFCGSLAIPGVSNALHACVTYRQKNLEYRTPVFTHCSDSSLRALDVIQNRLLEIVGIPDLEAFRHLNLAPHRTSA